MTYGITPMAAIVETKILVAQQPEQTIVLTGIGVPGPTGPQGPPGAAETPNSILTKLLTVDGAGSNLDADLLDGQHGAWYLDLSNATNTISNTQHGSRAGGNLHVNVTTSVAGFMAPGDKVKLDSVQAGSTDDQTPAEILTAIKTVDGAASGLDADLLDGQEGVWYQDRVNHTGVQAISTVSGLQGALDLKAPLASPTFTGDPKAPTPAAADNDTSIATTAFVNTAIGSAVGGASIDWSQIVNEPATFPPTVPISWANISGTPSTYPPTLPIAQSGVTNLVSDLALKAPLASPVFTGDPKAPTPATADNDTSIATTAYVQANLAAFSGGLPEAPVDGLTYGRKNATWATIVGGAVISDTAPAGPLTPGQLWWESDTGNTYIWYSDADSSQWIQQNIQPAGGADSSWPGQFINFTTTASLSGLKFAQADVGFGVRGTSFVWNDKADFSGTDVMTLTDTGSLQVGTSAGQTNALIKARTGASSNSLEWGHPNVAGYGSTLGCDQGSGASFITLHGEAGTTNNTHRTRGIRATIIKSDMLGGLLVQNVATASADNQTPVTLATINNAGSMTISSTVATAGATNAALTVAGGIGASRGMWIADNNGSVTFDGQGTTVGIDFTGPASNSGLVMRNRVAGVPSMVVFRNTSSTAGQISCPTITSTTYATTSDIRLKSEVQPATDARSLVDAIEVIEYTPVDPGPALRTIEGQEPADVKWLGISAQQTYSIYPPAVVTPDIDMPNYREGAQFGDEDFMPWMVDHSKLVPMLLANVQELNKRVDELTARIATLEGTT